MPEPRKGAKREGVPSDRHGLKPGLADRVHGAPAVAVSDTSTRVNPTGSWKYIRPLFRDRVAPCNQGCPVGIDIEGYMNLAREGRIDEAIDLLLLENPLPSTTGRVCYHPCETACNRKSFDHAVSIHAVERALGDRALERPLPAPAPHTRHERVAIIGAGPAGLSCAWQLARLGYAVTVFEAEAEPGGILRYGIPEYRLPKDVLAREIDRIRALGVEFRFGARVGREITFGEVEHHDAVFVASGVHRSRRLGVEGEELPGVRAGLEFLAQVNRGERPVLGRRVLVVGGGNTAMDCARSAVRLGAAVTVLYRRGRAEMPANAEEVEAALCEGVTFEFLAAPDAILSDARRAEVGSIEGVEASFGEFHDPSSGPHVTGVRCRRMALGDPDASGRRRPEPVPDSEFTLAADTVLTALGEEADLGFLPEGLVKNGGVPAGVMGGTRRAHVFVGGDLLVTPHTIAYAIGSGKRAAIGIDHTLRSLAGDEVDAVGALDVGSLRFGPEGNVSATRWHRDDPVRRADPVNEVIGLEDLNTAQFEHRPWHHDRFLPAERTRRTFGEANHGLPFDAALGEAQRCFNCAVCNGCEVCLIFCPDAAISRAPDGRLVIDDAHCKGCGICAEECPRGAITMTREGL
jgi:NADPH-dependent glutamate synthase beta subunit-like oxidoreductase/Pyruvate/2-oxoacid:ferredoxin oxidoreductase delta subunit